MKSRSLALLLALCLIASPAFAGNKPAASGNKGVLFDGSGAARGGVNAFASIETEADEIIKEAERVKKAAAEKSAAEAAAEKKAKTDKDELGEKDAHDRKDAADNRAATADKAAAKAKEAKEAAGKKDAEKAKKAIGEARKYAAGASARDLIKKLSPYDNDKRIDEKALELIDIEKSTGAPAPALKLERMAGKNLQDAGLDPSTDVYREKVKKMVEYLRDLERAEGPRKGD